MASASKSARLCELINCKDKVLVMLRPPTAAHGRIMERMKSKLPRYLGLDEHVALGIAWYLAFTHHVTCAALWDFMQDFHARGVTA